MLWVRRIARTVLRASTVSAVARAIASARGHRLVLVYHRLGVPVPAGCEVVPSVPVNLFKAQLQALGAVVDFVALDEIIAENRGRSGGRHHRPRVAVTFDDDLPSHVEHALPVLQELGVPATFFLSGRALHGLGAYWFQHLEALLVAYGEHRTAAKLRMPESSVAPLVLACERSAKLRRRVSELAQALPAPSILQGDGIAALGAAGMTIGFHTVGHDRLPDLDDRALAPAVSHGRADLAAAAGAPVHYFAYPHGKGDARSAVAVGRAGFKAAFTGAPRPMRYGDDAYRIGRWEPGRLELDELVAKLTVRLFRAAPSSSSQAS
jgi:peptidoglycan/xylan/chitin deacetylase (PgdA/CDA1 family)